MIGDAALASKMAADMMEHGIYVVGFSYPVVPKGARPRGCPRRAPSCGERCLCGHLTPRAPGRAAPLTGKARIRVQLSAAHAPADVERCVEAFTVVGRRHGVI